ncbi:hypothetical protein HUG10_15730 [Halorarum halophilum]|uniref:Uncharacterized protein n=1 Tax=Halorarum halophilum TaxID=2743090 RepID=A0A7D5L2X9_9EURY|nr:hypothetical protein [Halobaculum halophilum]QLG28903.1 hypothetical protein HUG10_15730 [Halobaculum halophilum]
MSLPLVLGNVLILGLGLLIAYQAFRGYRRNGSRMMFSIGVGFVLLSVGGVTGCSTFELLGLSFPGMEFLKTCLIGTGMSVISIALYR